MLCPGSPQVLQRARIRSATAALIAPSGSMPFSVGFLACEDGECPRIFPFWASCEESSWLVVDMRSKSGSISCHPSSSCQEAGRKGTKALPLPGNLLIAIVAWLQGIPVSCQRPRCRTAPPNPQCGCSHHHSLLSQR